MISIALGIGTATAVYGIADAVLLRPLPYPHSERLTWIAVRFTNMNLESLGSPDYVAWRRDNCTFASLAATQPADETMLLNGENAAEAHVRRVSANFLQTLGVGPALGRDFTAEEELPNGPKTVLLTDHFWARRFRRDPSVLGRNIRLDGQAYTIQGVLPGSFVFPSDAKVDILAPLTISPSVTYGDRTSAFWHVYGRLKPGVSIAQARAAAAAPHWRRGSAVVGSRRGSHLVAFHRLRQCIELVAGAMVSAFRRIRRSRRNRSRTRAARAPVAD